MAIKYSNFFLATSLFLSLPFIATSENQQPKMHDPRSEIYRNKTSGEIAWLKSLENENKENSPADVTGINDNNNNALKTGRTGRTDLRSESIYDRNGFLMDDQTNSEEKREIPSDFLEQEIHHLSQPHGLDHDSKVDRATMAKLLNYIHEEQKGPLSSLNTALYFLGIFYYYGLGDLQEPDPLKAIQWFQRAAENGHGDSQCVLGLILYFGIKGKVGKDRQNAMRWFYRASQDEDHPRGHWLLGKALFEGMSYDDIDLNEVVTNDDNHSQESNKTSNFVEAARLFEKAAQQNIPEAMHQLAIMYEYGLLDKDLNSDSQVSQKDRFRLAVKYYEKAASLDLVESLYHLGLMFAYGRGVELNYTVAADYFRRCAMKNHGPSMRFLAIFALNGYDQPNGKSNPKLATKWYDLCIKQSIHRQDIQRLCSSELDEAKALISNIRTHKLRAINFNHRSVNNTDSNRADVIQYQ